MTTGDTVVKKKIRWKYIEKVQDIEGALTMCDNYNIPDEGLESVDEYVDRMKTHYYALKHGNSMEKVCS